MVVVVGVDECKGEADGPESRARDIDGRWEDTALLACVVSCAGLV